jgi:integrase
MRGITTATPGACYATGLRITVHQFRHAAAAIYLKDHPGNYETVRQLLGHRDIQTTIRFYCGLETSRRPKSLESSSVNRSN